MALALDVVVEVQNFRLPLRSVDDQVDLCGCLIEGDLLQDDSGHIVVDPGLVVREAIEDAPLVRIML